MTPLALVALISACADGAITDPHVRVTTTYIDPVRGCVGEATFLLPRDGWWDYRDGRGACDDMGFTAIRKSDGLCIWSSQWCGDGYPEDDDFTFEPDCPSDPGWQITTPCDTPPAGTVEE